MKFKHVVLFGVVASIMSYLNSQMENENGPDKQETILNELKDLINNKLDDADINKKLEELKEEVPEHFEKATEMAKDVTDTLIDELNSIVASLGDITTSAIDSFTKDEEVEEVIAPEEEISEVEEVLEETAKEVSKEQELKDTLEDDAYIDLEDVLAQLEQVMEPTNIDTISEVEEVNEEPELEEEKVEEVDQKQLLIDELEDLINNLEVDGEIHSELDEDFSEEDYLSQIKDAINNTIILDEDGEEVDLSDVFEEEIKHEPNEINQDEIDEIFSEILKQEGLADEEPSEEVVDEAKEYLDELVDELNESMESETLEDDEVNEEETEDTLEDEEVEDAYEEALDVYAQINELYPYLSRGFVRAVYDLKEAIANEYPINHRIIILHRLSFNNLEDLRQFAEIVLNHDYRVNVDENKMIVDIFKEVINTDGKILTNIFEIANQAKLLEGNYEGYRIELI